MNLAAIPREFPQFGRSLGNLMRTRAEVFHGGSLHRRWSEAGPYQPSRHVTAEPGTSASSSCCGSCDQGTQAACPCSRGEECSSNQPCNEAPAEPDAWWFPTAIGGGERPRFDGWPQDPKPKLGDRRGERQVKGARCVYASEGRFYPLPPGTDGGRPHGPEDSPVVSCGPCVPITGNVPPVTQTCSDARGGTSVNVPIVVLCRESLLTKTRCTRWEEYMREYYWEYIPDSEYEVPCVPDGSGGGSTGITPLIPVPAGPLGPVPVSPYPSGRAWYSQRCCKLRVLPDSGWDSWVTRCKTTL